MKKNETVIISGCGFKCDSFNQETNVYRDPSVKINIGTATAYSLAEAGYDLILLSKTQSKLETIKCSLLLDFPDIQIQVTSVDLLDPKEVYSFVCNLPKNQIYHYVHSAGISSGAYQLENDNPYLSVEETPINLPTIEFEAVVKSLLIITQALLPIFKKQNQTKFVVVSSMSSVRSVPLGFSHTSAKAGLHNATRSLSLELNKLNIFISEVMPGAVDTGMYDNKVVQERVFEMGKMFGYEYDTIPMMPTSAVADAVKLCIESKAHILALNMVGAGQWPNLSS
ncbi:SDR family NAD(P)-dependent oxidoreductase [Porphyromonas gingivalis]|uniref:SDR family NAD(P)-dependent oxidoreductase n=1 Tax=Porphyromonas gingivalis TaxID=837 RepID=UPI0002D6FB65|nr:SDR family NAD(P)-dependent oxidoreductase [Porphyromonas gingivalis]AUR48192.1 SDR oxidoreductase [Porphyromonas gingivalis]SJL25606.1 short chain dehydrogenase/reductase oxidoreductase [Porphyromonas gingivalis]SJL27501.1 short chain dehydrogenase/reductase oxidoreductase [Porphyromonas gingivalis]